MYFPFLSPYLSRSLVRAFLGLLVSAAVLNAVLWFLAMRVFPHETPAAVLHYSIDVGIDFVGEGTQITSLPLLGLLLLVFNTVLGIALLRADQRASWVLWCTMPILQVLLLIAFYLLWRV